MNQDGRKTKLAETFSWDTFFMYAKTLTEKAKGDLFEELTRLVLITKPEYSSILKSVWILRHGIPTDLKERLNLPSTDEGIDLIAETFSGKFWAIQCKFKGQNQAPTYKELSTFANLANSYCKNISLALLVHTGEKGVRKRKLLGENYSEIGLDFWLGLAEEDWVRVHKHLKGQSVRPKPKKPRAHQQEAINGSIKHFLKDKATRGRLIMPCGTGKSLTAFWIAQALEAKSIIVAVPSLALIKQSLEDWTREFLAHREDPKPDWLVICSDESTSNLDKDDFVTEAYSLGIPTTTKVEEISSFLSRDRIGRILIFTTYQSSDRLIQAARQCRFSFDFAILDEAHKTVGIRSKTFATLLLDKNISVAKRMFMTATERVVRGNSDEVLSMDDPVIYGDIIYQLSFKDAIQAIPPIISDYRILTISVTQDEIANLIIKNKLITDNEQIVEEQQAQSLAAAIALRKATQTYCIRHAISFHRSIKGAENFKELNCKLNDSLLDHIKLTSSHISSKKSAGERARLLTDFSNEQLALVTNARCLTEGVDVPAIDCVLFADPKQSTIDIVQAAGRALRPYPGKQYGYIMLPLIVPDGLSFEDYFSTTAFKEVAKIIAALSTQDEGIAEELRITYNGRLSGGGKILIGGTVPLGLKLDINDFAKHISAKIWESVAKINWQSFEDARSFVHLLNLRSSQEWIDYCISGKKPFDIPIKPASAYAKKGWKGFGDWLGTGTVATRLRQYLPFEEARAFVQTLNLKNHGEWSDYCRSGKKPDEISANPRATYKNKGWKSIGDWLGTGTVAYRFRTYLPFEEAREFVHKLGLKNQKEWSDYCTSGRKPENISGSPRLTYKKHGWINLGDWLGTGTIAPRLIKYLPFVEARAYVQSLNLKSGSEWSNYCKSGNKPAEIPATPDKTYKNKGWHGMGDWLGTGTIANFLREYLPFAEARTFVQELRLSNSDDWSEYCKSGEKPNNIPANPMTIYKAKGWTSMGDWLGTGTIAPQLKKYLPFEEARSFINTLNLINGSEWSDYSKSGKKPDDIPANPMETYKGKGWISMGDWLGTGTVAYRYKKYLPFEEAKAFVHKLNLKSKNHWFDFSQSGDKPDGIPANPVQIYKRKGWISWGDWLGTNTIASFRKQYLPFEEARIFVHRLNINSGTGWSEYCKSGKKPDDIPANPMKTYKGKGWISMGDWLGTGTVAYRYKKYLPFEEAKAFVQGLNLKSGSKWSFYCKNGTKPTEIPSAPEQFYKEKGWISWGDWLGTGTIAPNLKSYVPYDRARAFVHRLDLKTANEWKAYCKSGNKPDEIPANPMETYKKKGWIGIGDWLGTGTIANYRKIYLPFKEARAYVQQLNITGGTAWRKYCKSGSKPGDIPTNPDKTYKGKGWVSWGDWLGTDAIAQKFKEYRSFEEAREFAHKLILKSQNDWREFCMTGAKPNDIPSYPNQTYKYKGWIGWYDWLGKLQKK